ncbi:DUF4937 domain-containing protein [uncultured Streptomyces sp.]|uniref:DUF4937 domain-containing protein n=1 Tax=uncultured Streptomyces sp. TaxID=174707 RepID=UPI0026212E8B|nr:DUF4937 domain-containing protein [uncultured Streptomyces sp.]
MLVKWIRCTVVDRQAFEEEQRKRTGLPAEPGFRGQGGGWSKVHPEVAHVFAFWDNRVFYDSFMARTGHARAAARRATCRDMQVKLFEYRFDVKTGFEPHFTDADTVRVAHSQVREDRVDHFALMQQKVWNPAMAGSPGMLRGVFGEAPGSEFLVLSMWASGAERGKYRPSSVDRLTARAETEADVEAITGDVVRLDPSWTV